MTTIILPTKNERDTIRNEIDKIRTYAPGARIVMVDGHSTDGTHGAMLGTGAEVIFDHGKGKGDALRTAFRYALIFSGEKVVFVDADGSYPVHQMPQFIDAIEECDMVIGERVEFAPGSLPFSFRVGDLISRTLFRILYGRKLDNLSGFRALTRNAIEKMDLREDGFGIETEITAKAVRLGLRIKNIPIVYWKRRGRSKFRPIRDSLVVIRAMLWYRWWRP